MQNAILQVCLRECGVHLIYFRDSYVLWNDTMSRQHGFPLVAEVPFTSTHWRGTRRFVNSLEFIAFGASIASGASGVGLVVEGVRVYVEVRIHGVSWII